jgi:EAL domain-containing protein (putative c-di-GMP-specific phosphodiesterase class I)
LDVTELRLALAGGQVRTMYQPIVRVSDRCPVGLEVLARLADPVRGLLEPDQFVAGMEVAGLGRALFEAVIEAAFADWHGGGLGRLGVSLAINLPLDVLIEPGARDWLEGARARHGVPAERIVIELTESQPLLSMPELAVAAAALRALGYGLAIDDVGPDIRDHGPLLDLPFTVLKLDRALVQATGEGTAPDFLRGVMVAARAAGLVVVAEGVEDEATWAAMAAHGVDHVQGYLVSRPLTAAGTVAWHAGRCVGVA